MKKNKQIYRYLLFLASICVTLGSCINLTYTERTLLNQKEVEERNGYKSGNLDFRMKTSYLQAPLLSQKGQINTEAWIGNGWGANISFAATNHLLLTAKYSKREGRDYFETNDVFYINEKEYDSNTNQLLNNSDYTVDAKLQFNQKSKQTNYELGAGYYNSINDLFRYEAFGGVAFSNAETNHDLTTYYGEFASWRYSSEKRKCFQYFAQGNIGLVSKHFEAAFMARLSYFNFTDQNFDSDGFFDTYEMRNGNLTIEPALRVGAGTKTVRLFCQYEYALPLKETDIKWHSSQFLAGVLFRFNDKIKTH